MSPIKRFISVAFLFVFSLAIIDYGLGLILDHYFFSLPESANECGKVHSRLCMEKDVVLMGSSRCKHHFVSSQLLDSINIYQREWTIYNYGLNGFLLNSSLCAVESMLNRFTPKVIVIEVDPADFTEGDRYAKGINHYAPFYDRDSIVKKYINSLHKWNRYLYLSHLVRYSNAYPIKIFRTLGMEEDQQLGYFPLSGVQIVKERDMDEDTKKSDEQSEQVSQYTLQNFLRVSKLCKKKKVLLLIVSTPRYKANNDTDMISNLCQKEDIPFFDYYNTYLFNKHPEWFRDGAHLNDEGAKELTPLLFRDIKPYLLKIN